MLLRPDTSPNDHRTMYRMMSDVFDVLYGSNVGFDGPKDVYEIASALLRFEQRFLEWQARLPGPLTLISDEELASPPTDFVVTRLRVVLTLRFLNFRILTHRPLLCKFLEAAGSPGVDKEQLTILRQVGANSLRICAQASTLIIRLTQWALQHSEPPSRQLLGAWWLTLYYGDSLQQYSCRTMLIPPQHSTPPSLSTQSCYYSIKLSPRIKGPAYRTLVYAWNILKARSSAWSSFTKATA